MQGLAGKIQIERESFSTDLDGQIDMSGLMTVSNMSLSFLANTENLNNSINYAPSNDERSFSDFDIDGTEKDWRQEAMSQTNGSGLAYNNNDDKETVDTFMDGMEAMTELQEAHQKQMMRFSNGFEFTLEEFETANNEIIEEIENDPIKYAEENGISVVEAMLVLEMAKDAKESGVFNEDEARAKYGDKIVDAYQGDFEETVEAKRALDNNKNTKDLKEHANVDKSADLTNDEQTAKVQLDNDMSDDLGFGETQNTTTSVAKSVSEEEPTTANLKDGFTQAAEPTVADVSIPTQRITVEHQNVLSV